MGVALVALAVVATPVAAQSGSGAVSLVSQSAWVGNGGEFELRLRIDPPRRAEDAELAVSVYRAVQSRSEFALTLDNRVSTSSISTLTFPLSSLRPDASGAVTVRVPVQNDEMAGDSSRVALGEEDGVYPVQVDLRERRGERTLDRFTTHLVHVPGEQPVAKLGVALILPFHLPAAKPDGEDEPEVPAGLAQSVEAARALPFALAPTPDAISGLATSSEGRAADILDGLRRVAAERTVLKSSYVPVSLPALFSAGLPEDAANQLDRGTATLTEVLEVTPDAKTWLSEDPIDADSLAALTRRGIGRMIVSDSQLEAVPTQKLTLTRSFLLDAGGTRIPAVAADSGLTAHFESRGNQVLRAHQLLADLAVLYLDEPGADGRALVALPRRSWLPDRQFVDTLAAGLAGNPLVEAISVDGLFTPAKPAASRSTGLVRRAARPTNALSDVSSELRATRRRLDGLASVLGRANPELAALERQQLMAESSELRSVQQRRPYVESVQDGIASTLDAIRMPGGSSITLTARRGEIPVTFQNRTGYPAQVVVKVESDKLDFPGGTTRPLDLSRQNTTERFTVVARTSGAFPLRITLESPDGTLVIGEARLTVRSTAAAGLSLFVALGAAGFLAAWWVRHALRGRRSRRLVRE